MKYSAQSSTATRTITPPLSTGPSIKTTVGERIRRAPAPRSRVAGNMRGKRPPSAREGSDPGGDRAGLRRDPAVHPAVEHALRNVLPCQREGVMVAPVSVAVQVAS